MHFLQKSSHNAAPLDVLRQRLHANAASTSAGSSNRSHSRGSNHWISTQTTLRSSWRPCCSARRRGVNRRCIRVTVYCGCGKSTRRRVVRKHDRGGSHSALCWHHRSVRRSIMWRRRRLRPGLVQSAGVGGVWICPGQHISSNRLGQLRGAKGGSRRGLRGSESGFGIRRADSDLLLLLLRGSCTIVMCLRCGADGRLQGLLARPLPLQGRESVRLHASTGRNQSRTRVWCNPEAEDNNYLLTSSGSSVSRMPGDDTGGVGAGATSAPLLFEDVPGCWCGAEYEA